MSGVSNPWRVMHTFTREDPTDGRGGLTPGTTRRVAAFAKPYSRQIAYFLVLVVFDACLVVASPLLFKHIIDDGVLKQDRAVVTWLALLVALLAVADAGLTLAQRWYSARIGEGLIFDLRAPRLRPRPADAAGLLLTHPHRLARIAAQQ